MVSKKKHRRHRKSGEAHYSKSLAPVSHSVKLGDINPIQWELIKQSCKQ